MLATPPAKHSARSVTVDREVSVGSCREAMAAAFAAVFGAPPTHWSSAPGRVDLMGSHTDYNQGWVLTMTVDRDTWAAGRILPDDSARTLNVRSLNVPGSFQFDLENLEPLESPAWPNYVGGMAWVLEEAGCPLHSAQILVHTTVPISCGLSSSAALEMSTSVLLEAMGNFALDPVRRALLGQRAKNHFVGVDSGIADQYTVSAGHADTILMLDTRTLHSFPIAMADGLQVMICDTRIPRHLVNSQVGIRRAQCEEAVRALQGKAPGIRSLRDVQRSVFTALEPQLGPETAKRARFIIEESARVLSMAEALEMGDRKDIRKLMWASYRGARDLYAVTVPEMDAMVRAVSHVRGAIGVRQAGAGFGGCMVAVIETEATKSFTRTVVDNYRAATGITADVFPVHAVAGAHQLED